MNSDYITTTKQALDEKLRPSIDVVVKNGFRVIGMIDPSQLTAQEKKDRLMLIHLFGQLEDISNKIKRFSGGE